MIYKHTPGPWDALPFPHDYVQDGPDYFITNGKFNIASDVDKENAILIAAAPDLLEVLQEARTKVAYMASGITHSSYETNSAICCLARIDKAITKATKGEK